MTSETNLRFVKGCNYTAARCHEFVVRNKSDVRRGFLLLGLDIKKRAK